MADAIRAGPAGRAEYRLVGSPTLGLTMRSWGFFVGFAALALDGPAAKYFQDQRHFGELAPGALIASVRINLTDSTTMDAVS